MSEATAASSQGEVHLLVDHRVAYARRPPPCYWAKRIESGWLYETTAARAYPIAA